MKLTIEINDTDDKLSSHDQAILRAVIGGKQGIVATIKPIADDADPESEIITDEEQQLINEASEHIDSISERKPLEIVEVDENVTIPSTGLESCTASNPTEPEEIDAAGMPWDARINPTSRGKIKTGKRQGMWKYIKQLDAKQPGLIASVEAENKARLIKQVHEPEAFEMGENGQAIAAQTFGAPALEPDGNTDVEPLDFATFMATKITPRMMEKADFANHINAVLAKHGLKGLPELISKQNLIPQIDQELDALWLTA